MLRALETPLPDDEEAAIAAAADIFADLALSTDPTLNRGIALLDELNDRLVPPSARSTLGLTAPHSLHTTSPSVSTSRDLSDSDDDSGAAMYCLAEAAGSGGPQFALLTMHDSDDLVPGSVFLLIPGAAPDAPVWVWASELGEVEDPGTLAAQFAAFLGQPDRPFAGLALDGSEPAKFWECFPNG
jgi:hypothetical protein